MIRKVEPVPGAATSPSDLVLRGGHIQDSAVPPGAALGDALGGDEEGGVGEVSVLLGALGRTGGHSQGMGMGSGGKGSILWMSLGNWGTLEEWDNPAGHTGAGVSTTLGRLQMFLGLGLRGKPVPGCWHPAPLSYTCWALLVSQASFIAPVQLLALTTPTPHLLVGTLKKTGLNAAPSATAKWCHDLTGGEERQERAGRGREN